MTPWFSPIHVTFTVAPEARALEIVNGLTRGGYSLMSIEYGAENDDYTVTLTAPEHLTYEEVETRLVGILENGASPVEVAIA